MLTRRYFIRASAITVAGAGLAPSWLLRAATPGEGKKKILISIFQRGAADGLNIVVPFFEKRYYDLRPSIADTCAGEAERSNRSRWAFWTAPGFTASESFVG